MLQLLHQLDIQDMKKGFSHRLLTAAAILQMLGLLLLSGCATIEFIPPPGTPQALSDAQRAACAKTYGDYLPITSYPQLAANGSFSFGGGTSFSRQLGYGVSPNPYYGARQSPYRLPTYGTEVPAFTPAQDCLLALGYIAQLPDGRQVQRAPSYGQATPRAPTSSPTPQEDSLVETNRGDLRRPVRRFVSAVNDHQEGILKASHAFSSLDRPVIEVIRESDTDAVVRDTLYWHGYGGNKYITVLLFDIKYDTSGHIDTITAASDSRSVELTPAFVVNELGKKAALNYFSSRIKNERPGYAAIIRLINASSSIKQALELFLREVSNG